MITTINDIEARLGRPLTSDEEVRADGLIAEATTLVDAWCRGGIDIDQPPQPVAIVASRIVSRALSSTAPPDGANHIELASLSFATTRTYPSAVTSGGVWLSKHDRVVLRGYHNHQHATNTATQ